MSHDQDLPDKAPLSGNNPSNFPEIPGMALYRGETPFDELEVPLPTPEETDAWDWAENDPEVRQKYGGNVVVVHQRKVWGAGKSYRAAWEQARQQPGCPPPHELYFVMVPGPAPQPPGGGR
jgi:hypothetical protein